MSGEIRVTFTPEQTAIYILPGTVLAEAAFRAQIIPDMPCGGKGTCGKCVVCFRDGAPDPTGDERKRFSDAELADGYRLACRARPHADCTVHIPPAARRGTMRILAGADDASGTLEPAVAGRTVRVPPAGGDAADDDAGRLLVAAGAAAVAPDALCSVPGALRGGDGTVDVALRDDTVIGVFAGRGGCFGAAVDIGTTTIACALVNLADGATVATAACANPQDRYGADVISRIGASEDPAALADLHREVTGAVSGLLEEAARAAGTDAVRIHDAAVAGNTAMQHLFAGVSPQYMGTMPFSPVFTSVLEMNAGRLGLRMNPAGSVWIMPSVAGFVGGDTVACLLAAGFGDGGGARLLVDIGTNGEIVLEKDGVRTAASAAAGPAFEGARIAQGMRAAPGAVEKVSLADGDVVCNVIGNTAPEGICGSGLLDAVAVMLEAGVIDPMGRILDDDELDAGVPAGVRARIDRTGSEPAFRLCGTPDAAVRVTQKDIRELQLGKAAMRAGMDILLEEGGVGYDALDTLLLAGGFGNFIRRKNALALGLLPPMAHEKITYIGNAALAGAKLALLSRSQRRRAVALAAATAHTDLSLHTGFQMRFAEAMLFG